MKKTVLALSLLVASQFAMAAQDSSITVKDSDATLIIKALESAKVVTTGGEDGLGVTTRAIVCDVSPNRAACTIVPESWGRPLYVTKTAARNLFGAIENAFAVSSPQEPLCDSGLCSLQVTAVSCVGSVDNGVSCTVIR